jgi:hypothetical protein
VTRKKIWEAIEKKNLSIKIITKENQQLKKKSTTQKKILYCVKKKILYYS